MKEYSRSYECIGWGIKAKERQSSPRLELIP